MFDQVRLSEYRPGTRTAKLRGGAGKTGGLGGAGKTVVKLIGHVL